MRAEKINYGSVLTWYHDKDSGLYFAEAKFGDGDESCDAAYKIEQLDDETWEWDLEREIEKEFDWVGFTGLSFEDAIRDCEKHYVFHSRSKLEMFKQFIKHEIKAQKSIMNMTKRGENAENSLKYWMANNTKSALERILRDIEEVDSGKLSARQKQLLTTDLSEIEQNNQ